MELVQLPDHIACSHVGTFSPVLFRFEGGDNHSGLSVEEYISSTPHVKIYGDTENARLIFFQSLYALPRLLDFALEGDFTDHHQSSTPVWFNFELRCFSWRISIYSSPQGTTVARIGASKVETVDLGEKMYASYRRLSDIYKRLYNVEI